MSDRNHTPPVPASAPPPPAERVAAELAAARALDNVHRNDQVQRRRATATDRSALRDVAADARRAEHARRENAADDRERAELASLYRHATVSGARARIRHQIAQSAEARGLRHAARGGRHRRHGPQGLDGSQSGAR